MRTKGIPIGDRETGREKKGAKRKIEEEKENDNEYKTEIRFLDDERERVFLAFVLYEDRGTSDKRLILP